MGMTTKRLSLTPHVSSATMTISSPAPTASASSATRSTKGETLASSSTSASVGTSSTSNNHSRVTLTNQQLSHSYSHRPYHPYKFSRDVAKYLDLRAYQFKNPAHRRSPSRSVRQPHRGQSSRTSPEMPRRKETKRITFDTTPFEYENEKEPHTVFKKNGSPIISPRSIRTSLAETDFDLQGNARRRKLSAGGTVTSDATNGTDAGGKKAGSPRPDEDQDQATQGNDAISARTEDGGGTVDNDNSLQSLTGVQLWMHRLLATHHLTLQSLGIEREEFPNTRLSLKQVECLLGPVISLCNMMKPEHFGIHVPTPQVARTMSDVHYWKLWESDTIDIGIFFMPPNSTIPLHNHPGMSVVTRVLYGSVKVKSYDLVPQDELMAAEVVDSTELVDPKSRTKWARVSREGVYVGESTMWLDPRRFNLHQLQANSDNGCALLDIMVPPYDNANRDCHHFQILEERLLKNERIVQLLEKITADHNEPSSNGTTTPSPEAPSSS